MFGLLKKFTSGLKKTKESFWGQLSQIWTGKSLDIESEETLEEALYTADFGQETVTDIMDAVREAYRKEKELRKQAVSEIGASVLKRILSGAEAKFEPKVGQLEVICLLGVNGAGKTTTAAKLAHFFEKQGHPTLIGACDTFRAAANEQIKAWCDRLNLDLVSSHMGADASAVAFDAYEAAQSRGKQILILDTAGRLHTKTNLMSELEKLRRTLGRKDSSAPQHAWLVIDGSLGSNSIDQAKAFHERFGLTGLIITKLDGTSRGGALVGIHRSLNLPVYYIGLGESVDDLQSFSSQDYSDALFGLNQ